MASKIQKKVKNISKNITPTLKKKIKLNKCLIKKKKILKQKKLAMPITNSSSKKKDCKVKKLISKFIKT
jgi:hypothetical protein